MSENPQKSTGIDPNLAGLLCYVLGWVTGLIFYLLEENNKYVRFHAVQSIVVFGTFTVAGIVLNWIPVIGTAFGGIIGAIAFVLWIVLMVKAYQGKMFKIPWAGDFAERNSAPRTKSS